MTIDERLAAVAVRVPDVLLPVAGVDLSHVCLLYTSDAADE